MVHSDLTIFSDLWHSVTVFSSSRRKGSEGDDRILGSGSQSHPLTSCVTSKPVSPSVAQGGGGPSVQASRAPLHPGPYLTHTGQGVRGWGRGSGHQPGVGGDTGTGPGGGPGAAQEDQLWRVRVAAGR